jgi:O-antigen/teichoic acid export membrane protein
MVLALPIAVGAATLADQIVPFLFKAAFLPAAPAIRIVIWVVPLMYASEFLGYIVVIAGKEGRVARSVIVSTSFNIILNILIVPQFGFLGAAVMTVATEAILVGQYLWMLRRQLRELSWSYILFRPLLAALLMGGAVFLLRYLPLLLNIAGGALLYSGLLFLLGVLGRNELRFIRDLRHHPPEMSISHSRPS